MLSSVGLEVMNSTNSELSWKTVTKGRRSKKPIARSLNSVSKVGKSVSPKRVGDFSGSDSDKLPHPSCSSCQRSANWQLRGIDGSATVRFAEGLGDFSGIELLAAAASMDADDADNVNKVDLVVEEAVKTKNSDALVCSELPSLKEHLLVTPNSAYSHAAMESYDEAAEKDADERNSNQVLHSDENLNHVVVADDILDGSPFTKIVCSSGVASERNINTVLNSVTVAHDEDCSSNMSECGITTASDRIQIMAQDVIAHDLPSSDISESAIDLQPKDTKVQKTPEPHGIMRGGYLTLLLV
ncbi:hypothetical protein MIMGU_mgv1a010884mg [Erythranthe guttata]|uniref:Uncharacterized protein n=1 Tax=Erythranthe guttata TaxID=4155 RepID=A0A022QBX3_ERYGU|nr:hypothetical protein MIMGU_mgv1a010884mg [Erythranthe guttata]